MNYKSIGLVVLAILALASCKKEVVMTEEYKGQEVISEQVVDNTATDQSQSIRPTASMDFSKTEHDFGTIDGNDVVETIFSFTNTSDTDLLISNAQGSCGCTVPDYPKQPIAPGEKADIKVSFSPKGRNGMQNKTVTLTTNTASGKEILSIKANIVK